MSEIRAQLIALAAKWREIADGVDQGAGDWSELTGTLRECADELELLLRAAAEALASFQQDELDAKRYRRLRVLGSAPGGSKQLDQGVVLRVTNLDAFLDADLRFHASRGEAVAAPASREAPPPLRFDEKTIQAYIDHLRGELAEAKERARQAEASREAPPDPRPVLIGHPTPRVLLEPFVDAIEAPPPASNGWQPIETCPQDGMWFLAWDADGGFYTYRDGPGFMGAGEPQPTHWMPLPLPPVPDDDPPLDPGCILAVSTNAP